MSEPLSFREYLRTRRTRYSPTSNFLRTLLRDDEFFAINSRKDLNAYLTLSKIPPAGQMYIQDVWKGYLAAMRRHERSQGERYQTPAGP